MCYKQERYKEITDNLKVRLGDTPDFIKEYFTENRKSAKTNNCYWSYIRDLLVWLMKNNYINKEYICDLTPEDLNMVKPMDVSKYMRALENGDGCRKNCENSLATKQNVFSGFWAYLEDNDYVDKNIMRRIRVYIPTETDRENISVPTDKDLEEVFSMISLNSNDFLRVRDNTIIQVMISTGIRLSELVGLDISDICIDGENRYVEVMGKGRYQIKEKSSMSVKAQRILEEYLKARELFLNERKIGSEALFISLKGGRLKERSVEHLIKKYSNNKIHCHMLRHYCGTYVAANNPIEVVADQLRHRSTNTSFTYYVKKDVEKTKNAVANM